MLVCVNTFVCGRKSQSAQITAVSLLHGGLSTVLCFFLSLFFSSPLFPSRAPHSFNYTLATLFYIYIELPLFWTTFFSFSSNLNSIPNCDSRDLSVNLWRQEDHIILWQPLAQKTGLRMSKATRGTAMLRLNARRRSDTRWATRSRARTAATGWERLCHLDFPVCQQFSCWTCAWECDRWPYAKQWHKTLSG